MTPKQLAQQARTLVREAANREVAARSKAFFKPWEKVYLYGVKTPELRQMERTLYLPVKRSWSYRDAVAFSDMLIEDRYLEPKALGLMLLARYHRDFEENLLLRAKSWLERDLCDNWAVTDLLSGHILSPLLEKFDGVAATVQAWSNSPNLWVRRASVVSFVKPAGKGRHLNTAYQVVTSLLADREDLMHKACGWLLREAGKADPARLESYLLAHGPAVPRTTVRYAIERFPESRRRRILQKTR